MPGIPQRVTDIFAQIDSLSKIKPKTEEEAYGLAQAKQELMNEAQRASEGMDQMDTRALEGDEFTGRIDRQVFDAPWRGEFDMPGNFERRQRMANSLAEDTYANAGRGYEFKMDPSQLIEGKIIRSSPAMAANAPELMNNEAAIFSGPAAVGKYGLPGDTRRLNKGKMLTEDDLAAISTMLSGGKGMRGMAERRYGGNEVYQKLFGGQ